WIYQQYDHEVGIRTVSKPGFSDASILKLEEGKYIAFTLDGNSKHCYLDPYEGTLGVLAESISNIICEGGEPIGIVDHLQFGNPENEQIFWTFLECIKAIKYFCEFMKIPIVGGKVSLYNETKYGPIKPTPVIGTLGLIKNKKINRIEPPRSNESIFIIGMTYDEVGGSEYYEYFHKVVGGKVPKVNLANHGKICRSVRRMLNSTWISAIHDCSKGGFIISMLEVSIKNDLGFLIDVNKIPTTCKRIDNILFSESHSRFIIITKHSSKVEENLIKENITFAKIGVVTENKKCILKENNKIICNLNLSQIDKKYNESISSILKTKQD
ncbi:MAG TPA: AIR synthase related protein, partial [Candidatus Nitrosocosmicus sp.]